MIWQNRASTLAVNIISERLHARWKALHVRLYAPVLIAKWQAPAVCNHLHVNVQRTKRSNRTSSIVLSGKQEDCVKLLKPFDESDLMKIFKRSGVLMATFRESVCMDLRRTR